MDFRRLSIEERYQFKKRAVTLVKSGKKQCEIAELYGIRTATVSSWMKDYKLYGNKGLMEKLRGVKSEDKKLLTSKQEQEIQKMITDVMPDQLKLDYALWTRKAVKEIGRAHV